MFNKHSHEKSSNEKKRVLRRAAEQMAAWAIVHPMHDETDAKKLLHELQVHQIELEMQSAELHLNQLETEKKLETLTAINERLQQSIFERNVSHVKEIATNETLLANLLNKISNEISQPLNEIGEIAQQIKHTGSNPHLLDNITKLEMAAQRLLQSIRPF